MSAPRDDSLHLMVVGLNHRTAPLELREGFAFAADEVRAALDRVRREGWLREAMLLSTCNRTELYGLAAETADGGAGARRWLLDLKRDVALEDSHLYVQHDRDGAEHLFRVACGLDSMVLGEVQIFGQVKDAYTTARDCGSVGLFLDRLMAAAIRAGKRARSETEIGHGAVSMFSAAVELAQKIFSDLRQRPVLVIGAGEAARLAGEQFQGAGARRMAFCNRTQSRAEALAPRFEASVRPWEALPDAIREAGVVACTAAGAQHLISRDMVRRALAGRPHAPLVFVDLAVPRNVAPEVHDLDDVFVYDVDAVGAVVEHNLERRRKQVPKVAAIVEEELDRFFSWFRGLRSDVLIRGLRGRFEQVRQAELARHLKHADADERERVERVTRALLNKLLHTPTVRLRALAREPGARLERLDLIRELFDLEDDSTENQ